VAAYFGIQSSPTFQYCVHHKKSDQRYYPREGDHPSLNVRGKRVLFYVGCTARVANVHQGALAFTVGLLVLGIYWRQAGLMDQQQDLQRAWVIAGMGNSHGDALDPKTGDPTVTGNGGPMFCLPGYRNYGQTPAFVRYLDCGFCPDPPPRKPNWSTCKRTLINGWIGTTENVWRVYTQPSWQMTTPTIIFYGRLTYIDVLKRKRHVGFIYRWHIDGRHEPLGGEHPKYADWK
jgi:hypothetical protein